MPKFAAGSGRVNSKRISRGRIVGCGKPLEEKSFSWC